MSSIITIPKWLKIFNIISGIIIIAFAILCLVFVNRELQKLIIILAVALIIIGILRAINGIFQDYLEWYARVLKIAIGVLVLPIAVAVLALSNMVPESVVSLLAVALILTSISRINTGTTLQEYPAWVKALTIIIGVLTIVAAGIVMLFSMIAEPTLIVMLAIIFLFSGTGWIYAAIKEIEEL